MARHGNIIISVLVFLACLCSGGAQPAFAQCVDFDTGSSCPTAIARGGVSVTNFASNGAVTLRLAHYEGAGPINDQPRENWRAGTCWIRTRKSLAG
jgi:hypothetical protein